MNHFIEITHNVTGRQLLIPLDKIVSISAEEDGTAFIEMHCTTPKLMIGIPCKDKYVDIYNTIAEMQYIQKLSITACRMPKSGGE